MKLSELLGDPAWLFDLGFPIQEYRGRIATPEDLNWHLQKECEIPALSSLSGGKQLAETCMSWSSSGLFFQSTFKASAGKLASATSLSSRTALLTLYIDTRWSPGVHRATSFCHRFDCILNRPTKALPVARGHGELNPIQRARSAPAAIHPSDISVAAFLHSESFEIKAFLKGTTLTGYSPEEFQEIGVFYTINDSVFGNQIMARTLQSPYFEDPSVWCRCKLLPATQGKR